MVETLLGLGADPFLLNTSGKSALDLAREGGFNGIVMRLQTATRGGEESRAEFARHRKGTIGGTTMVMRLRSAGALKDPGKYAEATREEREWGAEQIMKNEKWLGQKDEEGEEITADDRKKQILEEHDKQKEEEWRRRVGQTEETPEEVEKRRKEQEEEKQMQLLLHPLVSLNSFCFLH